MKNKNKIIIAIKTITLVLLLILGVLLPNLVLRKYPKKSYANSSFESNIQTALGTITLRTSAKSFKEGDIVPVEIYVGGENINGLNGSLSYDKHKFQTIDLSSDVDKLTGWGVNSTGEDDLGDGIQFFVNNDKNAFSNGTLATIYFRVIEDIEKTDISIKSIYICNTDYEDNIDDGELPNITLTLEGEKTEKPDDPNKPEEPKEEYIITYNSNTTEEVKGIPENGTKIKGKDYNIYGIEPSRLGYTFNEWNTKADGTGITYQPGSIYTNDENLTLYAQWEEVPKLESLYLLSDIYKIGNIDITKYQEGDKYISRVTKETTLKEFIDNLETNGDVVQVIKQDGQTLTENEYIGTGMQLVITKGVETIKLNIAVMGDTDRNGEVTPTDLADAIQKSLGENNLNTVKMLAVDINEDGEITPTDLAEMIKLSLE